MLPPLSYLSAWNASSTLLEVAITFAAVFGEDPPVFARPSPTPPLATLPSTPSQPPPAQLQRPINPDDVPVVHPYVARPKPSPPLAHPTPVLPKPPPPAVGPPPPARPAAVVNALADDAPPTRAPSAQARDGHVARARSRCGASGVAFARACRCWRRSASHGCCI